MRKLTVTLAIIGLLFVSAGTGMFIRGIQSTDKVRSALAAERIFIPQRLQSGVIDPAVPSEWSGKPVVSAASAEAMSNVIKHHSDKISGGKTYAELMKDDPRRATVLTASNLRSDLYLSVMGFEIARLVTFLGALFALLGLVVILLAYFKRSADLLR